MRFAKSKIAVAVAATAVVALGSTAAYAYFTTTATGQGTASVGTSKALTFSIGLAANDALLPDGIAHPLVYSITNTASFQQDLVVTAAGINLSVDSVKDASNNVLTDCAVTPVQPKLPAGTYPLAAGQSISFAENAGQTGVVVTSGASVITVPSAVANTGSISMANLPTVNQNDCKLATVNLSASIS